MNTNKIVLWDNPPYIDFTNNNFSPSITPYIVNETKTAIIVCPGGGYGGKADHEREPVAKMFNEHSINAFTLDYNVAPCHKYAPLSDIQRAIRTVRSLGYEKVGVCGFSAGGHLTCTSATMYDFEAYPKTDKIDELSARPDAFIPCYPVVTMEESFTHMGSRQNLLSSEWQSQELVDKFSNEKNVTPNTPPCFIWHTATDNVVPVKNSFALAEALSENKVYFELHIFPVGWHGLGLAYEHKDIGVWSECACTFLKKLGF